MSKKEEPQIITKKNKKIITFPKNNFACEEKKTIYKNNLLFLPEHIDKNIININRNEINDVSETIKKYPDISFFYLYRALLYFHNKNYPLALTDLKKIIKLDKNNAEAYHLYAHIKYISSSYQEAIWAYDRAINLTDKRDKTFIDMLNSRALAKINLGLFKEAVSDFNILIKLDCNNINAYENRAMCNAKLKHYKEALDDFNRILETNVKIDMPSILIRRAEMKHQLYLFDEAISDCNCVININNHDWRAYYQRALCEMDIYKYKEAIQDFDIAIQINNTYSLTYFFRGYCKRVISSFKEAINDFDMAIKLDNTDWEYFYYRAKCNIELKNYNEAINNFDKAIQINDKSDLLYICRAQCLYEIKQYKEALADCDKAIQINDKSSAYYFIRVIIKDELEELEKIPDIEGIKNDIDIAISLDDIWIFHLCRFLININQKKFLSAIKDLFNTILTFSHFKTWSSYFCQHNDIII